MAIYMIGFTDWEGAEIAEDIRSAIKWNRAAASSCADHMKIRHEVYFVYYLMDVGPYGQRPVAWSYTPKGLDIQEWLNGNVSGNYAIQETHVFFEDHDDALLCYLRFAD